MATEALPYRTSVRHMPLRGKRKHSRGEIPTRNTRPVQRAPDSGCTKVILLCCPSMSIAGSAAVRWFGTPAPSANRTRTEIKRVRRAGKQAVSTCTVRSTLRPSALWRYVKVSVRILAWGVNCALLRLAIP
eukprot:scaffold41114_cov52-Prasinocladus_malaysianus.AAC.1